MNFGIGLVIFYTVQQALSLTFEDAIFVHGKLCTKRSNRYHGIDSGISCAIICNGEESCGGFDFEKKCTLYWKNDGACALRDDVFVKTVVSPQTTPMPTTKITTTEVGATTTEIARTTTEVASTPEATVPSTPVPNKSGVSLVKDCGIPPTRPDAETDDDEVSYKYTYFSEKEKKMDAQKVCMNRKGEKLAEPPTREQAEALMNFIRGCYVDESLEVWFGYSITGAEDDKEGDEGESSPPQYRVSVSGGDDGFQVDWEAPPDGNKKTSVKIKVLKGSGMIQWRAVDPGSGGDAFFCQKTCGAYCE